MTCIAANQKEMAADSRMVIGGLAATVDKVFHIRDSIVGVAGDTKHTTKFLAWFRKECPSDEVGMTIDEDESFLALVLNPRGLFLYTDCVEGDRLHDKYFAIGTGAEVAMAAMDNGKSPTEAVRHACRRINSCGLPVKTLTMKPKAKRGAGQKAVPVVESQPNEVN